MKDSYFTLAMLKKALSTISKDSNSEDGDVPILISVNEDNPSVIRLAALVQTEDDDEEEENHDEVDDFDESIGDINDYDEDEDDDDEENDDEDDDI